MCGYKEGIFLDLDSYQCGRRAQKSPSSLHSRWQHKCKVCAVAKITWKCDCLTAYFIEKYTFWRTHFSSYFIPLRCPFETGPHVTQAAYKLCVAIWTSEPPAVASWVLRLTGVTSDTVLGLEMRASCGYTGSWPIEVHSPSPSSDFISSNVCHLQ